MELYLQIYHLDNDSEAEKVIDILNHLSSDWQILRPNAENNSILIPVRIDEKDLQEFEIRQRLLKKSLSLIKSLSKKTIDSIRSMDLNIGIRIVTNESYLPLPHDFVEVCGHNGLEINIFNSKIFIRQIGFFNRIKHKLKSG